MPLSDTKLRGLKPGAKPYKVADFDSLYVLVAPTGAVLWRMNYRLGGKQKTLALGSYPAVSLSTARTRRDDARKLIEGGVDPSKAKRAPQTTLPGAATDPEQSFQAITDAFFKLREKVWSAQYRKTMYHQLKVDVLPVIGPRDVRDIEPPDVLKCLRAIETRGALVMAHKVRFFVGQIFRYAIAEGKAVRDPTADLKGALQPKNRVQHYARVEASEVPKLFADIHDYQGDRLTKNALLLALHTFVRTDEFRFAHIREFKLKGPDPLWRIPPERMKKHREHLVPLTPKCVEIIKDLETTLPKSGLLFGADTRSGVISENTALFALYRLGYKDRQTVHGFRRIASTTLNENGFDPEVVELQLAHDDADQVRAAYNSAKRLAERREMMRWWSEWIGRQARKGEVL